MSPTCHLFCCKLWLSRQ